MSSGSADGFGPAGATVIVTITLAPADPSARVMAASLGDSFAGHRQNDGSHASSAESGCPVTREMSGTRGAANCPSGRPRDKRLTAPSSANTPATDPATYAPTPWPAAADGATRHDCHTCASAYWIANDAKSP